MPAGRPTKYDPSYCDLVKEKMGEGFSLTAFAGFLGVDRATVKRWQSENDEFRASVMRAKAMRMLKWEQLAMNAAGKGGGPGASTMIIFGLKNMDRGQGSDDIADQEWTDVSTVNQNLSGNLEVRRIERHVVYPENRDCAGLPAAPESE